MKPGHCRTIGTVTRSRHTEHIMRWRITIIIPVAAVVAGCSFDSNALNSNALGSFFVAPGKFNYYRCPDLVRQISTLSERERELTALMERANQDTSGMVVNAVVYSPQLATTHEELQLAREAAAQKKCSHQPLPPMENSNG